MEVYTLNSLLRREDVIDRFESLIWTERYKRFGDFELSINSTIESRTLLKAGTRLAMSESYRVMEIERVEEKNKLLTVKGRSIEGPLLEGRVAKNTLSDLTTEPKWVITNNPAAIARKIFHDICVLGNLNSGDIIPFINEGPLLTAGTIAEPADIITVELDPKSVYDAIKDICDTWNLGFRILRNFDMSQLWFDIYTGSDRTTGQTVLPPVVFAPELDNLQNVTEFTSTEQAKNVAYVFSPAGYLVVYPSGVDPTVSGFDRRVLMVNADDITSSNPDVPAALAQRGYEELAKNRTLYAFDGEINEYSQYKYGVDYQLGDLVETRNSDGVVSNMLVTEQIFVSDKEGKRSYPTLSVNAFINVGSWVSWLNNKQWIEMGATDYWSTQP